MIKLTKYIYIIILLFSASYSYATDFTADVNCMGAWAMTSSGSETDLSGESGTLLESASDDMPTGSAYPYIGTGASRTFQIADTEYLYHADGNSTDISGADQNISMCAWIKRTDASEWHSIGGKWSSSGDADRMYTLTITDDLVGGGLSDEVAFDISANGVASIGVKSTSSMGTGVWMHVCGTYNEADSGNEMRIYVNGQSENTVSYSSGIFNGGGLFKVGFDYDTYFEGQITDVIVFNDALSSAEVLELYKFGIDGTEQLKRRMIIIQ